MKTVRIPMNAAAIDTTAAGTDDLSQGIVTLERLLASKGDATYFEGPVTYVVETPAGYVEVGSDAEGPFLRLGQADPAATNDDLWMGRAKGVRSISDLASNVDDIENFRLIAA